MRTTQITKAEASSRAFSFVCLGVLVLASVTATVAQAQSLVVLRDIEKRLLEQKLAEFQVAHDAEIAAGSDMTSATQALRRSLADLTVPVETLRQLESRLAVARGVAEQRSELAARLRNDIYDRMQRLQEIERELAGSGTEVWGEYSLNFGPDEGPGTLTLRSEAGRIEGSYVMASGRRGTVRGEISGNQVRLDRIDSQRGRDRTLEAIVSTDRRTIQGTWLATELGSGEQTSGVWRALRQDTP